MSNVVSNDMFDRREEARAAHRSGYMLYNLKAQHRDGTIKRHALYASSLSQATAILMEDPDITVPMWPSVTRGAS